MEIKSQKRLVKRGIQAHSPNIRCFQSNFVQYNIVKNIYGVRWNYQASLCNLSYTAPFISTLGVVYKTFRGKMNVTSRKLPQTEVRTE